MESEEIEEMVDPAEMAEIESILAALDAGDETEPPSPVAEASASAGAAAAAGSGSASAAGGGEQQDPGHGITFGLPNVLPVPDMDVLLCLWESRGMSSAAAAALEKEMTTVEFSQDLGTLSCVICMDDFEEGTEVKHTKCNHVYHTQCISRWLNKQGTCPMCRHKLRSDPFRSSHYSGWHTGGWQRRTFVPEDSPLNAVD